ncbi:bifunctional aspartate transaminase/aspartate 4-decarboxylase [Candidatus Cetobacterium colombiensis]|uniref:Bifunctional aspartate transaminase/aspartate 4-decarboxylase n=1 Tax=Candidatus Cetobacterium colombiensis TaxID=3073100 RepID=A0ABU4WC08_9FUSO|nr:bifunctional aspartate transaminase/aspartate 4-decarboxylase [Candidatus Cetobacterium colombiensis]MDX8335905.1 bifunctional aspartate transaminase/aspartate 4-decarboxylase [Candidatus Cetobacterium colombiensis]
MDDLKNIKKLSAFEFSSMLLDVAAKNKENKEVLNAGRGNPNWINTSARRAFFRLSKFAMKESESTFMKPQIAGYINSENIYSRFLEFLKEDKEEDIFLKKVVNYCIKNFNMDKDELISEFTNGCLGNNYPVPSRILKNTEKICFEFLRKNILFNEDTVGNTKLFATEGASAAMCYIFKTLKINGFLKKGDKIAINTPIFSPYFQIPHLHDYEIVEVDLDSKEENNWELTNDQLEILKDSSIKMLFMVNPSNPGARALKDNELNALKSLVENFRKDLIILSDDVYATFVDNFKSIYGVLPYNTILVYSYSKIFGTTGVRLGVVGINEHNILDDILKNYTSNKKSILKKRYSLISLNPDSLSFIDRLSADSRDVALSHTSGLSTPQQILMALFSLVSICDKKNSYIEECKKIVRKRYNNLYKGLGIKGYDGEENSKYYTILDIYKISEALYGKDFSEKLKQKADTTDFLYYLASQKGTVLIDAVGFKASPGTLRVSQANLPSESYIEIGKNILDMINSYKEEFENEK